LKNFPQTIRLAATSRSALASRTHGLFIAARGVEVVFAAEAPVCLAGGQQALGVAPVPGGLGSLIERTLVPFDAEPGEAVEDHPGMVLGAA
jgi:hypothetical protein